VPLACAGTVAGTPPAEGDSPGTVQGVGAEARVDYTHEHVINWGKRWTPVGVYAVVDIRNGSYEPALLDGVARIWRHRNVRR
jgi:hypothetical protein